MQAMSGMAEATKDTKEYHSQVQNVTKSLGALNAVYEMELKDAQSHTKALNKAIIFPWTATATVVRKLLHTGCVKGSL